MEKRTYKEAVDLMVEWWIEKSFKTPLNQNNGDNSESGGLAFLLMNTVSANAQRDITSEKIQKFKKRLSDNLMKKENENRFSTKLDVDYGPNQTLSDACKYAEINPSCLPCKTFTFINKENEVEGRYQYGGNFFKI